MLSRYVLSAVILHFSRSVSKSNVEHAAVEIRSCSRGTVSDDCDGDWTVSSRWSTACGRNRHPHCTCSVWSSSRIPIAIKNNRKMRLLQNNKMRYCVSLFVCLRTAVFVGRAQFTTKQAQFRAWSLQYYDHLCFISTGQNRNRVMSSSRQNKNVVKEMNYWYKRLNVELDKLKP